MSSKRKRAARVALLSLLVALTVAAVAPYSDWLFLARPVAGLQAASVYVLATCAPVDRLGMGELVQPNLDCS